MMKKVKKALNKSAFYSYHKRKAGENESCI